MAKGGEGKISAQNEAAFAAVVQSGDAGQIVIPGGDYLLNAEFERSGPDLVLVGADGTRILVQGFFADTTPPDLMTSSGASIEAALAAKLAGPLAPGQYAQNAGGTALAAIGKVSVLAGKVVVKHADGTKTELKKGDPVFKDDVLDTEKSGSVGITFDDGTTFSLGGSGRMVLDELVYDPAAHTGSGNIAVLKGAFSFVSGQIPKSHPDALTIKTPVMTVGIRGTAGAGNTETIVLLAEKGGVAGELTVTTLSGQTLTINVPGLAATIGAGGSLISMQMSQSQMQQFNAVINANPNAGGIAPSSNSNGNNDTGGKNPFSPPAEVPGQKALQQEIQQVVEKALAAQKAEQDAKEAAVTITNLLGDIGKDIETVVADVIDNTTKGLDAAELARQAAEKAAVAEINRLTALMEPFKNTAHAAFEAAEVAASASNAVALSAAVDDADAARDALAELYALAQTAAENSTAGTNALRAATALKTAADTDADNAQALEDALDMATTAATWRSGAAITDKIDAAEQAVLSSDALDDLRTASEAAAAAETAARAAARNPVIQAAAAAAVRDIQQQALGEARIGLTKAVADYITSHDGSAHEVDWYGITTEIETALRDYQDEIRDFLLANPTKTATDANLDGTVVAALTALKVLIDVPLAANVYAQGIKAWLEAEASIQADYDQAALAAIAAQGAANAATAAVVLAEEAADTAAGLYLSGQAVAASDAAAAATAAYAEVVAANAAQTQVEMLMSGALLSLAEDLGSASSHTIGTAMGDLEIALQAVDDVADAATSTQANLAFSAAVDAVTDIGFRLNEVNSAVTTALDALTKATTLPGNLADADATSQTLAAQAVAKAQADYAKAVAIQSDVTQQKTLVEAYLEQVSQTVDKIEAAEAVATAASITDASLAATRAGTALNKANEANAAAAKAATALNNAADDGTGRDVALDLNTRIAALVGAGKPMENMTTGLGSAQTSYYSFSTLASALGNTTITGKLATAIAALDTASGNVVTANTMVDGAAAQIAAKYAAAQTAATDAANAAGRASTAKDTADAQFAIANTSGKTVTEIATAAQAAAAAAATATTEATLAAEKAALASTQVQALAALQTQMDGSVATASAAVKSAVEAVAWAKADYAALAAAQAARLAVNSTDSNTDAADKKAGIDSSYAALNADGGMVQTINALHATWVTASASADQESRAAILSAFTRATQASKLILAAKTEAAAALSGTAASAQEQTVLAEQKAAAALAATTIGEALRLSNEAQAAAAEAQRLAGIIATDKIKADSALSTITAAYADALAAAERLGFATELKALADSAQSALAVTQAKQALVLQYTTQAQTQATIVANTLNAEVAPDLADALAAKESAHDAALDAGTEYSEAAAAAQTAQDKADDATEYYNGLTAAQKSSVITAYYNQAIKAAADAKALAADAAVRLTAAQLADSTASADYATLADPDNTPEELREAAVDAATAKVLSAKTTTGNVATEASDLYAATALLVGENSNAGAFDDTLAAFLLAKPGNATATALQNSLTTLTTATNAALTTLAALKDAILGDETAAAAAHTDILILDALIAPDSAQVIEAQEMAALATAKAQDAAGLRTAMDQQVALITSKLAQIQVLAAQFQAYANDAPVLNAATLLLPAIDEDAANNSGATVSSMVAPHATDAETASASLGMALTATNSGGDVGGYWEYFSGTTWESVPADIDTAHALLLNASDKLRFVPSPNWNSALGCTPTLTFHAWDGSAGTAHTQVDITTNGSFTAYSAASLTGTIVVNAVNDLPTVTQFTKIGIEDSPLTFSADDFINHYSDMEKSPLASIKIITLPVNGTLKLSGLAVAANAVIAADQLANLTFVPNADWTGDTSFQWVGSDGTGFAVIPASTAISMSSVTYRLGRDPVDVVQHDVIVSDADAAFFTQVTVTITNGTAADRLVFEPTGNIGGDGYLYFDVDGVWVEGGMVSGGIDGEPLVITFTEAASAQVVQDVLRSVHFASDATESGSRTLSFVVTDDQFVDSMAFTRSVNIDATEIAVLGANQDNSSLRFDGIDDYAQADAATLAVGTGTFTIEALINPLAADGVILSKGQDGGTSQCTLMMEYGYLKFVMSDDTHSFNLSANDPTPLEAWTHVAVTRTGTHFELYINGKLAAEADSDGPIDMNATDLLVVGGQLDSGDQPVTGQAFHGQIDTIRLWDAARTATDIEDSSLLGAPANPGDHLVADWTMTAQVSGAVPDTHGGPALTLGANANDNIGDPVLITPPSHALGFNGGYVQLQHAVVTRTMTVEAWVNPDSTEYPAPIFTAGHESTAGSLVIGTDSFGYLTVTYKDAEGVSSGVITSTVALQAQAWNHVAVVFDTDAGETTGTVTLYVDGVVVGGGTGLPVQMQSVRDSAYAGWNPAQETSFYGQMADLRIWEQARTEADIQANMNVRLSGDQYGLMANMELGDSRTTMDGELSLTTAPNNAHRDDSTYDDGVVIGDTATVAITPPSFSDTLTTNEETPINGTLMAVDAYGDPLTYAVTNDGQPEHGWLWVQPDGTFNYRPFEDFVGTDTFTVDVSDCHGNVVSKTMTVTVNGVDEPMSAEPPLVADHDAVGLYGSSAITLAGGLATGSSAVTYEAWARQETFGPADQFILSAGGSEGDTFSLSIMDGLLRASLGGFVVNATASMDTSVWHHLAARLSTDGTVTTISLFVDGEAVGQETFDGGYDISGDTAYLGRSLSAETGGEGYLRGKLSDIRVYTEARSQTDIRADMSGSDNAANLEARWTGANIDGVTLVDSSTNDHNGSFTGSNSHGWGDRVMAVTHLGETLQLGGMTLDDMDGGLAPEATISVSLHAKYGTLHVAAPGGIVAGNDSSLVVFTGTKAAITQALTAVTYTPAEGFLGRDRLDVLIDEQHATLTRQDGGSLDILVLPPAPTSGADIMTGTDGADAIYGLAGDDILIGGAGADTLDGGTGADIFVLAQEEFVYGEIIDGGAEAGTLDTIKLMGSAVSVDLSSDVSNIDAVDFGSNEQHHVIVSDAMVATADANGDGVTGDLRFSSSVLNTVGVTIDASAVAPGHSMIIDGANLEGDDLYLLNVSQLTGPAIPVNFVTATWLNTTNALYSDAQTVTVLDPISIALYQHDYNSSMENGWPPSADWYYKTTATASGTLDIAWTFGGFNSWYMSHADAWMFNETKSNWVHWEGSNSSLAVDAGDVVGFQIQCGNYDGTNIATNTLTVSYNISSSAINGGGGADTIFLSGTGLLLDSYLSTVSHVETIRFDALSEITLGANSQIAGIGFVDGSSAVGGFVADASGRTNDIVIQGGAGADTLIGGAGNDTFIGGDGNDTAVFSGNAGQYHITTDGTDILVTDTIAGRDGSTSLTSVESLHFQDRTYDNLVLGTAGADQFIADMAPAAHALALDGSDDYVAVSMAPIAVNSFTFETWIKLDTSPWLASLLSTTGWNPGAVHLIIQDDVIKFGASPNSVSFNYTVSDHMVGTLRHVAIAYDDVAHSAMLYVDGQLVDTQSFDTPDPADFSQFTIGAWNNGTYVERFVDGSMADVRLWSTARSQDEILSTMNERLTGAETDLLGNWQLDGDTADTASGAHDGTFSGGTPTYTALTQPAVSLAETLVVGGSGDDSLTISYSAALTDADFANLHGIERLVLGATGSAPQSVTLGATSEMAGVTTVDASAAIGTVSIDASGRTDAFTLLGGTGDDWIGIGGTSFELLDGGTGTDILAWEGGTTLDLTNVAGILQGFEAVDLSADGAQTLIIDASRLLSMTEANNALTGTADTLVIMGTGDSVQLTGGTWTAGATNAQITPNDGHSYSVYSDSSTNAQVYVDNTVSVTHT